MTADRTTRPGWLSSPRPGVRRMRVLPVLEPHRGALEKCVFCPKLCRTACPVSNAEPRETLTPWGKMTGAWSVAHGDVPLAPSHADPMWACTGCFGCRELCEHVNPVADVLLDARAALAAAGVLPAGARRVVRRFAAHEAAARDGALALASHPRVDPDAPDALLIGCGYVRGAPGAARDAVDAAAAVTGRSIALVEGCCGLPLRLAGDALGFKAHAAAFARSVAGRARVVVVDAGCALTLRRRFEQAAVVLAPRVELLVELASGAPPGRPVRSDGPVRWHDPCQLGRGLGVYAAPRAVLQGLLGRPPDEFLARGAGAVCSGAGGLLPSTMPTVAAAIARARVQQHVEAGGGRIVTGCAASLLALRRAGRRSGVVVEDLVSWIARAAPR